MRKIKVAVIGDYPPRRCGIATFTQDFVESLVGNKKKGDVQAEAYVVAVNDNQQSYEYPKIVTHLIRQSHQRDYIQAAKFINYSDAEICILQHEFGIYGGESGVYILPLVYRLELPLVVIFHTVPREPSYNEKVIIQEICKRAEKVSVMSNRAVDFLKEIYDVAEHKIALIEHGVPDYNVQHNREEFKKKYNLENKKTLLTFGLLSRNKGIETVIEALPPVVEKHPDLVYIVIGKTHPTVVRHSGEEYRNYLSRLTDRLNLTRHVYFKDEFVTNDELFGYLSATDIYVTPYLTKSQITSGTLAYAIGTGNAAVSTPYWHAEELLAEGRGILFDFGDARQLTTILLDLLDNPGNLKSLRLRAYEFGRRTTWPECGYRYFELLKSAISTYKKSDAPVSISTEANSIVNISILPEFNLGHVERLTDSTGIIQHAKYCIPNRKEGYCLDDNARALLMTAMAIRQKNDPGAAMLLPTYLSYIHYMQNDDGTFRNFLSYDRRYLDEVGEEDSSGRAIWALGYLILYPPSESLSQIAREIFSKAYPYFGKQKSLRGMANYLIGISHYMQRFPSDEKCGKQLRKLTDNLIKNYRETRTEYWCWFESELTYDNGILPLALMHAYDQYSDSRILEIAKEAIDFLDQAVFKDDYLSLIGNQEWYVKDARRSQYAQQPIDAMAMVLMYRRAYQVFGDQKYLKRMFISFKWFLGENDLRIPLYDFETNGCCDGLEDYGVNLNQGAESTLAYLISHLQVLLPHL